MTTIKHVASTFVVAATLAAMPMLAQSHEHIGKPGEASSGHSMPGMMHDTMQGEGTMHGQGMMQDHGMMQGGGMMPGMMGGMGGAAAGRERPELSLALQNRRELGLSDSQARTLQDLVERFRGTAEQRIREIETAESELAVLLKQDTPDQALVEEKVRSIERLRADLRLERIRTIGAGRAALDSGQRAKLDQIASRRSGGMMGGQGAPNEQWPSTPAR